MSLIKALAFAVVTIHPSVSETDALEWSKDLVLAAEENGLTPTSVASVVTRASQWRPDLINCNGRWSHSPTKKALPVALVLSKKLKCSGTMDFGLGQLNCPGSGACGKKPTRAEMLWLTKAENNLRELSRMMAIKKNRCAEPSTPRLLGLCKDRGWRALLNSRSHPPVERVLLNIESRYRRLMKKSGYLPKPSRS